MVTGRIVLRAPAHPLLLAKTNELALDLKGPAVRDLFITQRGFIGGDAVQNLDGGDGKVQLQHHPDGSAYINVVPQRPGRLEIQLNAMFSDGAFEVLKQQVDVVADVPPVKLDMNQFGRDSFPMALDLSEGRRTQRVPVQAIYPGLKSPLWLDPRDVTFEVKTLQGEPPIQFDRTTGEVHALRIGHALITAKYQGVEQTLCVIVNENARDGAYRANCNDLIENGDKGATAKQDAEASVAQSISKLPYGPMDMRRGRFLADDRVELVPPGHALQLAQDSAIGLKLHGPELVRVECSYDRSNTPCQAWTGNWPVTGLNFTQGVDGNAAVHVFPQILGEQEFTFFFLFADGGVALKKIRVPVEIGNVKPRAFGKLCGEPSTEELMPLELMLDDQGHKDWRSTGTLARSACYDGIRGQLTIDPKLVHYEMHTEAGPSPVELDAATGTVKALHLGQALITAKFAGLSYSMCVKVRDPAFVFEKDVSNCRKLRAAYGASLPPLNVQVVENPVIKDVTKTAEADQGILGGIKVPTQNAPPTGSTPRIVALGSRASTVSPPGAAAPRPAPVGPPPIDALAAATISPTMKDEFPANERLTLLSQGISAVLDTPTALPLRLTGPAPLQVSIYQRLPRMRLGVAPSEFEEDSRMEAQNAGTIERAADGTLSVHVRALQIGTAEFRVKVLFSDGGVAAKTVRLPVKMPEGVIPALVNGMDSTREYNLPVTTLHLGLQAPDNIRYLSPALRILPSSRPIPLFAHDVQFSVKTIGEPVIDLDRQTGKVTGLRVGHALVMMSFAGVENKTCVVVVSDAAVGDSSNCEELHSR